MKVEIGERSVDLEAFSESNRTRVADEVLVEMELGQRRVDLDVV